MSNTILTIEKLGKRYNRKWVVSDVNLAMEKGSALAFLGCNGAGKTTTIGMMLGLIRPDAGSVRVFGHDSRSEGVAIRRRTGYVPERPRMIGWMSVEQIMSFVGHYYPTWDADYARTLCREFGLDPGIRVKVLSRGEEAKLSLLLALAHRPELLVLDDATSGVDTLFRHEILESLVRFVHDQGTTVFFATHLIGEVEGLVDTVVLIKDGTTQGCLNLERLKADFRRITMYARPDGPAPELPDGAHALMAIDRQHGCEWIIDNYSLVSFSGLSSDVRVEIEDLSLEEIYIALEKSRKE
ncbi:ABC transporter ATP-binding protein [bacterium]|nr:ABC transporter ATP-binding protein [bacterium]